MTSRIKDYIRLPGVQNIVSFSGGKDSTAIYLQALKWGLKFRAVLFDTGNEHEITLDYSRQISARTGGPDVEIRKADFSAKFERKRQTMREKWPVDGVPQERIDRALELFHPTGNPFLDMVMLKGRFPASQSRFCTDELKVLPMMFQVTLPALRNGPVVNWHGVRAQESKHRATYIRFARCDSGAAIWRPIHHWTHEQVFALHSEFGIEPNPLYKMGMGRVGCMPCIMARKSEIMEIAQRFPEHIERIAEWERIVSEVSKRGNGTFFAEGTAPYTDGYDPEKEGYYDIHQIVAWSKTSRGGRQMSMDYTDKGSACSSRYGLCE